jgi:hypothetical protein
MLRLCTIGILNVAAGTILCDAQARYASAAPVSDATETMRHVILWTRLGRVSWLLARAIRPLDPALLILSIPRSGSSWVGGTLGLAKNAMYLREPITQMRLAHGARETLVEVDAVAPADEYRKPAERAFAGLPAFPPLIVTLPDQWRLGERRKRRLVIKEVNPLACAYLVGCFRPRLIFLVRHPAGVALSFCEQGWWSPDSMTWEEMGARLGALLRTALDVLKDYGDSRLVRYEDLCLDPLARFRDLFAFAELDWGDDIVAHIQDEISGGDHADPYSTARLSRVMPRAWSSTITADALQRLRKGYAAHGLPCYQAEEDWTR